MSFKDSSKSSKTYIDSKKQLITKLQSLLDKVKKIADEYDKKSGLLIDTQLDDSTDLVGNLKDQADDMMQKGNYVDAVSAYSIAVFLNPNDHSLRALMKKAKESESENLKEKADAMVEDMNPDDNSFSEEMKEKKMNETKRSETDNLKKQADAMVDKGSYVDAVKVYSIAVWLNPDDKSLLEEIDEVEKMRKENEENIWSTYDKLVSKKPKRSLMSNLIPRSNFLSKAHNQILKVGDSYHR